MSKVVDVNKKLQDLILSGF